MSHTPRCDPKTCVCKGPTLDQEPMVIQDPLVTAKDVHSAFPPPPVVMTLEHREFHAISQVIAAALFAFHPELWLKDPQDTQNRLAIMEAMLEYADRAMTSLTNPEAHALKEKFTALVKSTLLAEGKDLEVEKRKLLDHLSAHGIRFAETADAPAVDG